MAEPLINVKLLINIFKKKGFNVFSDFMINMKGDYRELNKELVHSVFLE